MPDGYRVGRWKDLDNYECEDCPYATLDEDNIVAHRAERHGPGAHPPRRPALSPSHEPVTARPPSEDETEAEPAARERRASGGSRDARQASKSEEA